MLKEAIVGNKKVRLVSSLPEISAFLIAGKLYSPKGEEILTDGKVKLVDFRSNNLKISGCHWLVFRNKDGIRRAKIDRDWWGKIPFFDKSFLDLCLAMKLTRVKKAKFNSRESGIVKSHFTHFITDVFLDVTNSLFWIIIFDESGDRLERIFSNGANTIVSFQEIGIDDKLDIFRTKGYLFQFNSI